MSGAWKSSFGQGDTTYTNYVSDPHEDEKQLIALNTELARNQVANIDQMEPFQREMFIQSLSELRNQGQLNSEFDKYLPAADQARFAAQDMQRAGEMGAGQGDLSASLTKQLLAGGTASPEQLKAIQEAADAAIASGSSDIDISTQRGVSQIADELANQRGMRLSDTPIMREAALLERGGQDQKAALIKSVRAGQANNVLNYPLAVAGVNLSQQDKAQAATQFQAQLRQLAQQNRLSMYGTTSGSGIGLANVGAGAGSSAEASLAGVRSHETSGTGFDPAKNLTAGGSYLSGAGNLMKGLGGSMGGGG